MLDIDLPDIAPETVGRFDVVLYCGILNHLRDPLSGLIHIAGVCVDTPVVETAIDTLQVDRPATVFYPDAELAEDPSNWWGPNPACVAAMLRDADFARVEHTPHPVHKERAISHAYR